MILWKLGTLRKLLVANYGTGANHLFIYLIKLINDINQFERLGLATTLIMFNTFGTF